MVVLVQVCNKYSQPDVIMADVAAVLGVELLNEPRPFAGDVLRHPTLLGPGDHDQYSW